ncbi:MAG: YciI family protein [Gammaproteobacteria bacterium]
MKYLLLQYGNETAMMDLPKEEASQMHGAYMAYTEAMKKAGAYVGNSGLRPTSDATTVRAPGGKVSVLNGPFAETKEQLGGYYLIEAPDLDAALAWAKRHPGAAHGSIEVRPVWA